MKAGYKESCTTYIASSGAASTSFRDTFFSSSILWTSPVSISDEGINEETLNISYKKCSRIMVSHSTRGNDTVHLPGLRFVHVEVWPWSLKLLVEAGHYSHVVDLLGTEPLTTDTTYTNYNTKHWSVMEKKSLYVSITKNTPWCYSLSMSSQKKTDF